MTRFPPFTVTPAAVGAIGELGGAVRVGLGDSCSCNRSFGEPYPGERTPRCVARSPMPWEEP